MASVDSVTDYIILQVAEDNRGLSILKLQKLLYYAQAWHLVHYDKPLFDGKFQAWIHGPVCRKVYERFNQTHMLYSCVTHEDIRPNFNHQTEINKDECSLIDSVLDAYAGLSGVQLEQMTHQEEPWIKAREGYLPSQRCEVEISEDLMKEFYHNRIA